jgi:hypothetical protein
MLTQAQIDMLKTYPGLGWISALRPEGIQALAKQGEVQMSLFDACNLAEIQSDLYPGERLMVCYNRLRALFSRHPGKPERAARSPGDAQLELALDWCE